jgi:hypothetical protein
MMTPHTLRLIRHHLQLVIGHTEQMPESKNKTAVLESTRRITSLLEQVVTFVSPECPRADCPLRK